MYIIITICIIVSLGILLNYLLGYKKHQIIIDFDERYTDVTEHSQAIVKKLAEQGKVVELVGNRRFIIDNKHYFFTERTINIGGVPMQRTILVPQKDNSV
ncbi:hypothetical protein [Evansella cellulosilytica]|uniref:Uncharacterized protein n=1 Tax=Evansella cellulosilytica (strain ATCC 21833 / DSM 2522 / FERM P-1141 / JCM 9156 / N-4) TaxID=649639 RepID=E6TWH9_EVAC2|nr:hypothetical protein [Evansella cellulosilytica]ADU32242.1 hypothetical protein Bcell_4011 [Evansella cellulosilytica DSM 2522]